VVSGKRLKNLWTSKCGSACARRWMRPEPISIHQYCAGTAVPILNSPSLLAQVPIGVTTGAVPQAKGLKERHAAGVGAPWSIEIASREHECPCRWPA